MCANGAETPRLLLMSKSNAFPHGLANSNGNVGKYLMFDSGGYAFGLFDHPLNEYKSVVVTRVLHDYYGSDPKRGFYGGGGIDGRFDYYPVGFALTGMPPEVAMGRRMEARPRAVLHAHERSWATPVVWRSNRTAYRSTTSERRLGPAGAARNLRDHPDDLANFRSSARGRFSRRPARRKSGWTKPRSGTLRTRGT